MQQKTEPPDRGSSGDSAGPRPNRAPFSPFRKRITERGSVILLIKSKAEFLSRAFFLSLRLSGRVCFVLLRCPLNVVTPSSRSRLFPPAWAALPRSLKILRQTFRFRASENGAHGIFFDFRLRNLRRDDRQFVFRCRAHNPSAAFVDVAHHIAEIIARNGDF